MSSEVIRKELKTKFKQLEWLIIAMAGSTLGSLQIIRFVFLSTGVQPLIWQVALDWLFVMTIITGLVHFSFREISKIQNELITKREQANKAEKRIQHIIDMTQDALFTIDCEGNFTFASKSAETLTGYSVTDILTMNIRDILSADYRSFIYRQLKESKDLAGRHLFIDAEQRGGAIVPIEVSFIPIKGYTGQLSGFQGIARDITERKEVEKAHQEKERYLQAIAKVGQLIIETTTDLPYKAILEILCKASGSHQPFVLLYETDASPGPITDTTGDGGAKDSDRQKSHKTTPYIIIHGNGASDQSKATELLLQQMSDNGRKKSIAQKEAMAAHSSDSTPAILLLPLLVESKIAGMIGFSKPTDSGSWKSVHINLLSTTASMISQAMERQKTNMQLKRHFLSLAKIISKALAIVDPYTASHQQRLAEMVCLMGGKMDMNPKQLEWLYFCGLLHDVGKIAVPATILSKPGQLTSEEWGLVRSHVKRSHEILQDMDLPDNVVSTILHHHERPDGSGYPYGIKEDALSTEARILGICDVVEAMSSHRPYRPARTKGEITAELKLGRGPKYDPKLVDLMLTMINNNELNCCFQGDGATIANATSPATAYVIPNPA